MQRSAVSDRTDGSRPQRCMDEVGISGSLFKLGTGFDFATLEHTTEAPATQDLQDLYVKSNRISSKP